MEWKAKSASSHGRKVFVAVTFYPLLAATVSLRWDGWVRTYCTWVTVLWRAQLAKKWDNRPVENTDWTRRAVMPCFKFNDQLARYGRCLVPVVVVVQLSVQHVQLLLAMSGSLCWNNGKKVYASKDENARRAQRGKRRSCTVHEHKVIRISEGLACFP